MLKNILILLLLPILICTGCIYQMPRDDCLSTLPTANNPLITGEKPASFPGMR